jgi:hypothetical protein
MGSIAELTRKFHALEAFIGKEFDRKRRFREKEGMLRAERALLFRFTGYFRSGLLLFQVPKSESLMLTHLNFSASQLHP